MVHLNLYTFCQITIGLVFAISAVRKLRDFSQFIGSVRGFGLLPSRLVTPSASFFLIAEIGVIGLLISQPWHAFLLGSMLLLLFSAALASALWRKMQMSCNCFGPSHQPISPADLVRNGGFLACALYGLWFSTMPNVSQAFPLMQTSLISFVALAFVLTWMQVGEIYRLFHT